MTTEPFLPHRLQFHLYIMEQIAITRLMPSISIKQIIESDYYAAKPKIRLDPIFKKPVIELVKRLKDEIYEPIIISDDFESEFADKIGIFQVLCFELFDILNKATPKRELIKLDLSFYESTLNILQTSRWLDNNSKKAITELTENLKDYELMAYSLIADRRSELEIVWKQIDHKRFWRTLYSAYLCYSIIAMMLLVKHYRRHSVLSKALEYGIKYAEALEDYAELFDIRTSNETMEKMKRAEQWERQQLQDN